MPCRTDDYPPPPKKVNKSELTKLENKLGKRLDRLTRMLCSALSWMEEHEADCDTIQEFFAENKEAEAWWKEHKRFDEARKLAESLTPEQKNALLRVLKEQ